MVLIMGLRDSLIQNLRIENFHGFDRKLHKLYQLSIHILDLIQTFDWELRRNH